MRITRLDLHGFKSFFHRTSLALPPGISAVVGPNGCGKSNIADAIRWVMGEQSPRQLRGRSMEDVIFSGSQTNQSLGRAEVSLTVSRTNGPFPAPFQHYEELNVTRRLYRSGESEYLINNIPCRLKDIVHLFMDTGLGNRGYAVIEQGSIGRIVDSRPEDRRAWIEEAAGVVKYKAQRTAAQAKMEQTEQNLARVADILAEVSRQAESLRRQAKRAEKYKVLKEKVGRLDLTLAALEYERLKGHLAQAEARVKALEDQRQILTSQESAASAALEADRLRLSERERAIGDLRTERLQMGNRIKALEQEQKHLQDKAEDLKGRESQDRQRLAQEQARRADLEEEAAAASSRREDLLARLSDLRLRAEDLQDRLEEAQAEAAERHRAVSRLKDSLVDLAAERAKAHNAVLSARERLSGLSARQVRLSEQAEAAEREKGELIGLQTRNKAGLAGLNQEAADLKIEEEELAIDLGRARAEKTRLDKDLGALNQEYQRLAGQLSGLEGLLSSHEGLAEGVRFLLHKSGLPGENFLGLLAEGVRVDKDLEPAVEAALGQAAEYLLVRDQDAAMTALDRLKAGNAGRAGLMSPDLTVTPEAVFPAPPPPSQSLREMVEFSGPAGEAAKAIIGATLLAPDLTSALQVWRADGGRRAVVTPQGDTVLPPGAILGGREAKSKSSLLARQRAVRELKEKLDQVEARRFSLAGQAQAAAESLVRLEEAKETLTGRVRQVSARRAELDKEASNLAIRLRETDRRAQVLSGEAANMKEEEARLRRVEAEQSTRLEEIEARKADLDQALVSAEWEAESGSQGLDELKEELTGLKVAVGRLNEQADEAGRQVQRVKRERERVEEALANLEQEISRAVRAQAELVLRGQQIDKDIRGLDLQARQQETRIGQEEGRLAIYQQELTERSAGVRALRENLRKLEAEAVQASVSLSEIRLKRDHLAQDVAERHQMDLGLAYGDLIDRELNEPAAREELAALKEALDKLGPVNPEAVTEYQELTERRGFLESQVADLTASLEDLRSAIRKINQTTLARFMETFRSVASKMEEICPILFGEGAQAQLVLLEPDKPLESGLDLKVQPPGKRLTSLSLLSGGEKALAAACLLFAIFLNRPTPFCLLDEVDAPLDEANVERFNKLLREIGRHSQILMITHKQRTMEVVDSLFGVTMPEPGVSRLVSVKLDRSAAAAETLMEK